MSDLSGDERAVWEEVRAAQSEGRDIGDGCARVIGSWYQSPRGGQEFASTGTIASATLWSDLVGNKYQHQDDWMKQALDILKSYLANAGERGPVPGWSTLWVR